MKERGKVSRTSLRFMKVFTNKSIEKQRNLEVVFLLQLQKKTRNVLSSTQQTNLGCTDRMSFSKESQRRIIKKCIRRCCRQFFIKVAAMGINRYATIIVNAQYSYDQLYGINFDFVTVQLWTTLWDRLWLQSALKVHSTKDYVSRFAW
jgi:hypothetical protein